MHSKRMSKIAHMICDDDFTGLANLVNSYFGITTMTAKTMKEIIPSRTKLKLKEPTGKKYKSVPGCQSWSTGSWLMWLKSYLAFPVGHLRSDPESKIVTATLHVFFITIPETSEMVIMLDEDNDPMQPSTARSKIGRTLLLEIQPIDRTAKRLME
jgi:hypothetical protein